MKITEISVGNKIVHHYCGGSIYGRVIRVNKKSVRIHVENQFTEKQMDYNLISGYILQTIKIDKIGHHEQ